MVRSPPGRRTRAASRKKSIRGGKWNAASTETTLSKALSACGMRVADPCWSAIRSRNGPSATSLFPTAICSPAVLRPTKRWGPKVSMQ